MRGIAGVFLDTNVLVYARDRSEPAKGPFAAQLLQDIFVAGRPQLSVQVLSEFFWTVTRKLPIPLTTEEAAAETRRLITLTSVAPLTQDLFNEAMGAVAAHGLPLGMRRSLLLRSSIRRLRYCPRISTIGKRSMP
jgi:predicted nucleic acid-binding protein